MQSCMKELPLGLTIFPSFGFAHEPIYTHFDIRSKNSFEPYQCGQGKTFSHCIDKEKAKNPFFYIFYSPKPHLKLQDDQELEAFNL